MKQCLECKRPVVDAESLDGLDSNFCWWHTAGSPKPMLQLLLFFAFIAALIYFS